MNEMLNTIDNKYTFWTLLDKYTKIEIPIIQRDYAQGRPSEGKIRNKLINHIANALASAQPIELDFVYGMVQENERTRQSLFIPIDGQQRLTTLFLLHWYTAWKEGKLDIAKNKLLKFTYETRPSAHSFLELLCNKTIPKKINSFKDYFVNEASWFDNAWLLDPSVEAFVIMLDCIRQNEILNSLPEIFNILTTSDAVSFYFLPLNEFGLSEDIYIRMNARGKQLTPFEKFKSKLFVTIDNNEEIKNEISQKIEYEWVDNLWPYRSSDYTIDESFMNILRFVALIVFYERDLGKKRKKADIDLEDEDQLVSVFDGDAESIKFLISTLDLIPLVLKSTINIKLYPWIDKEVGTMEEILKKIIERNNNSDATTEVLLFYATLQYLLKYGNDTFGIEDYLIVVRNMLVNTRDKSQREWPRLLPILKNLVSNNIYKLLLDKNLNIEVIYTQQRDEEIRKAQLISENPNFKALLHKIENNKHFQGNIGSLLDGAITNNKVDYNTLKNLYEAYKIIAENNYNEIWGDLLGTDLYTQTEWRVEYDDNFKKHHAVIELAKDVMNNNNNITAVLLRREKEFITQMQRKYKNLSFVNQPKEQLYLLYILSQRIMGYTTVDFFNNGRRFGWLTKNNIAGYSALFDRFYGLDCGMIYQSYISYFQYNRGILEKRTPKVLIAYGAGQKPFERLVNFALESE